LLGRNDLAMWGGSRSWSTPGETCSTRIPLCVGEPRRISRTLSISSVPSPSELAWFEMEYPEDVTVIEVWTTDTLMRRINVEGRSSTSTTGFLDFGADIGVK